MYGTMYHLMVMLQFDREEQYLPALLVLEWVNRRSFADSFMLRINKIHEYGEELDPYSIY